jgi:uncharacterized alkaline shock family protein YloU
MSPVADLPDPDAIAAAIATCPSVSGLSGGIAGEIATYLPGRRVAGIRIEPGEVEVHVIARYGSAIGAVDSEVRAAVQAATVEPITVNVVLEDVEDPFAPEEEEAPELPAGATVALPEAPSTAGVGTSPPGTPAVATPAAGTPTGTPGGAAPESGPLPASPPSSPSTTPPPGSPPTTPAAQPPLPPPPIVP